MIEEIPAFRTEDGKTFGTREDAERYELHQAQDQRIAAYLAATMANDSTRARSRAGAAIRRFLRWELGQGEAT